MYCHSSSSIDMFSLTSYNLEFHYRVWKLNFKFSKQLALITDRIPTDNQRDRHLKALLKSISSQREVKPVWEQLATDRFDPWQVVLRQVFIPYSRLLVSTAFVVFSRDGCLWAAGLYKCMCILFHSHN